MSCGTMQWRVKVENSEPTVDLTNREFRMDMVSTITGCQGRTRLYYLWLVRLKLFPLLHQLGSLVEDPCVCGHGAWIWNTFPSLLFYFKAECALLRSENFSKQCSGSEKTIHSGPLSLSLPFSVRTLITESRFPSIWQSERKIVQWHCMSFQQWLWCLPCLTFKR